MNMDYLQARAEYDYFCSLKKDLSEDDKLKFRVIENLFPESTKDIDMKINLLFNLSSFDLDEDITSFEDLAVRHIENTQGIDVEFYEYIDLEQLGRDLAMQDLSFVTDAGYLVVSGDFPDEPIYKGVEDITTEELIYRKDDGNGYQFFPGYIPNSIRTKDGHFKPVGDEEVKEFLKTAKVRDLSVSIKGIPYFRALR